MSHWRHSTRLSGGNAEIAPRVSRGRKNVARTGSGWLKVSMWQPEQIGPAVNMFHSAPTGEEPHAGRLIQSSPSTRVELLVYGSLGFAAVVAVIIALAAMFNFAGNLERVAQRLNSTPTTVAETNATGCGQNSFTNITGTGQVLSPSNKSGAAAISPAESTIRRKADLPTG